MLPMPKPASPPNTAKAVAIQRQFLPRPFRIAYIGPPASSPLASNSRYLTASTTSPYLVAMPTSAVIHIQNSAPGPPTAMAVATPAILPVPTVADRQVISAANGVISPAALPSRTRPFMIMRKPWPILKIGMKPSRICRNRPVPRISTIIGTPQTIALIEFINSVRYCITDSPRKLHRNDGGRRPQRVPAAPSFLTSAQE